MRRPGRARRRGGGTRSVRFEGLELRLLDLSLRQPVGTAVGVHRHRPVAFARVLTDETEGWGECGALPDGTAVDPPIAEVWPALADAADRLADAASARGGSLPPASQVAALFDAGPVGRLVAATVEMAVLDAELRAAGTPLWRRLGVDPAAADRGVLAGAVAGIPVDRRPETLIAQVAAAVERGAARVRLKIEPGWDVAPVQAVRAAFPELRLQVDANGSYRLGAGGQRDAMRLAGLDDLAVACVEQPLPPADLTSHATLARQLRTPVCLDESLTGLRRLVDALRYRACGVACCKPARLGGLLAARRAQARCQEAGVPAFVGGLFETGLGRSANAALAGLPGFPWPGDLSDPASYLVGDPFPYPGTTGGRVPLAEVAGVGAPPDAGALARATAEVVWRPSHR
ncbi:MAG: enolase C-terminal domain-like protein [Acidimicrobiales bacterium]